jgi:hypothetical protein
VLASNAFMLDPSPHDVRGEYLENTLPLAIDRLDIMVIE